MTADDMLAGSPCILCQSLPYMDEGGLHALVRHQQATIDRLTSERLALEVDLHATRTALTAAEGRVDELTQIASRLNAKIARRAS